MKFDLTSPCANCPFRSDIDPFLREERYLEILDADAFACHKTTVSKEDEDGNEDRVTTPKSQSCAGRMILLEREGRQDKYMRMAHRFGVYDPEKLDKSAPVYDSIDDLMERVNQCGL